MNEDKEFKILNDNLIVTVTQEDKLILPTKDGKKEIGSYKNVTVQTINKENIKDLKEFIENERDNAQKQIDEINKQLEPIKDIVSIDDDVMVSAKKAIDKGTKNFKQKMLVLNDTIAKIAKRNQLTVQLEYLNKQMNIVNLDLTKLNTVLNR